MQQSLSPPPIGLFEVHGLTAGSALGRRGSSLEFLFTCSVIASQALEAGMRSLAASAISFNRSRSASRRLSCCCSCAIVWLFLPLLLALTFSNERQENKLRLDTKTCGQCKVSCPFATTKHRYMRIFYSAPKKILVCYKNIVRRSLTDHTFVTTPFTLLRRFRACPRVKSFITGHQRIFLR